MTHRGLRCSGFCGPLAQALNHASITTSRLALVRSAISLRGSYSDADRLGFFWLSVGSLSTVMRNLDRDLVPTSDFLSAPMSERGTVSFLLAEALTHSFAQNFLGIDILLPVERLGARLRGFTGSGVVTCWKFNRSRESTRKISVIGGRTGSPRRFRILDGGVKGPSTCLFFGRSELGSYYRC